MLKEAMNEYYGLCDSCLDEIIYYNGKKYCAYCGKKFPNICTCLYIKYKDLIGKGQRFGGIPRPYVGERNCPLHGGITEFYIPPDLTEDILLNEFKHKIRKVVK